jgi:hypothetical protein
MNIPTAAQAREAANGVATAAAQTQLQQVGEAITKAIAKGDTSCYVYCHLLPGVRSTLEERGYTCTARQERNDPYTEISFR